MMALSGFQRLSSFIERLMSGGALEIVLLIVLIVVALILFLLALWILWKLLVLLGKGLLWLLGVGTKTAREQSASRREARLAMPPRVATGWSASPRQRLGRALAEARRLTGSNALRIVLISGGNMSELCDSLGATAPGVGSVGIAAGGNTILIDASAADNRTLRRLAHALPWRRPVDGLAIAVTSAGIPADAIARAGRFARMTGMRTAVHFVLPSTSKTPVWRTMEGGEDGEEVTSQLTVDAARIWLAGGSREGLADLALARSRELPATLDRAMMSSPSAVLDIASLSMGGAGLHNAVAQTVERTRPSGTPGFATWIGVAVLAVGVALTGLVALTGFDDVLSLRSTAQTAAREATSLQSAGGIPVQPGPAQIRRVSGIGVRLSRFSEFSPLMPLAALAPHHRAPRRLGASLLEQRVLRPLGSALDARVRELLEPEDDPKAWLERARSVDELLVAWQGLADEPSEVDVRRLFEVGFGSSEEDWYEGTELALTEVGAQPPLPSQGGLDIDELKALARENLIGTMRMWADRVYTNGPVARSARLAGDRSLPWDEQHKALGDLRTALQDPENVWLTSAEDKPDYRFEIEALGGALGLSLLGQVASIEARSEVSRIRLAARRAATSFILPQIGPLMVRSGSSSSGQGTLAMSPKTAAWLAFLDRVDKEGFVSRRVAQRERIAGPVSLERAEVAEVRNRLRAFERFAANLPTDLPSAAVQGLVRELANQLIIGVTIDVENSVRSANALGTALSRAQSLAGSAPTLEDLVAVEDWLRQRNAMVEADRVAAVHSRVAQTVLETATELLLVEDPLGIWPDPTADRGALARRAARGLGRLDAIFEQFAAPFIEPASAGEDSWNVVRWHFMERDIAEYRRGDGDAALSRFEALVNAYVESQDTVCNSLGTSEEGRDDYIAGALLRLRRVIGDICSSDEQKASELVLGRLEEYFERHIAWLWPYAADPAAPELPPSTLADFVRRVHEAKDEIAPLETDDEFAKFLMENLRFWTLGADQEVAVRFRIIWRARPSEERLAENVVSFEIEGPELSEDGVYTWRFGSPFSVRMRLARNSAYRFVETPDPERLEWTTGTSGNGSLLRIFTANRIGAVQLEVQVVDEQGNRHPLRVSARISHPDETTISIPEFAVGEMWARNRN